MEVKRLLTLLLLMVTIGCGGAGTEVVSPPNPTESPGPQSIETDFYTVSLDLPAGWTFEQYYPDLPPGPDAFEDSDPDTITAAHLSRNSSRFTFFFSYLQAKEALVDYVRDRRPTGDLEISKIEEGGMEITSILFFQEEPGPRGGFLFDLYTEAEGAVLWLRAEFVGSDSEKNRTLDEFNQIMQSVQFVPKRR